MVFGSVNLNSQPVAVYVREVGIPDSIVDAAKGKLLQLLKDRYPNLKLDEVLLGRFESVTWNDGSLGCPEEGGFYTQALVPGYRIVFHVGNEEFTMHTDSAGLLFASPQFQSSRGL